MCYNHMSNLADEIVVESAPRFIGGFVGNWDVVERGHSVSYDRALPIYLNNKTQNEEFITNA